MKAYTITKLLYFKFIRIKVRMLSRHRLAFANLSLPIVFTRKPINAVTIPNPFIITDSIRCYAFTLETIALYNNIFV